MNAAPGAENSRRVHPSPQKGKPTAKVFWDLAIVHTVATPENDHITDQPDDTNARREIKPHARWSVNNPRGYKRPSTSQIRFFTA